MNTYISDYILINVEQFIFYMVFYMNYLGPLFKFIAEYLASEIKENGFKGVIPIIAMLIFGLMFISPAYVFVLFYNMDLFNTCKIFISIITILVFDTMLFLFLFIICSPRDLNVDEKNRAITDENCKLSKHVVRTLLLMGFTSICLVGVYGIGIVIKGGSAVEGIITLGAILLVIFLYYFLNLEIKFLKLLKLKRIDKRSKLKK